MTDETKRHRRRPKLAFLHVGKTGGSAIRAAIDQSKALTGKRLVKVFNHRRKLAEFLDGHAGMAIGFVVREPVSRYVSAFNSRLRGGREGTHEWRPEEREVFSRFPAANDLAEGLSSADEATQTAALEAMRVLNHMKRNLTFHFESVDLLERMKKRIVFIGHLPTLTEDFEMFRAIAGLAPQASLPSSETKAHRAPASQSTKLSPLGEENVRRHFQTDYPIYEWCLKHRADLVAAFRGDGTGKSP